VRRYWALPLAVVLFTPSSSLPCGVERWSVKTGTDADAGLVNLSSPASNTIATMRGWAAPNPIPTNNRVSPFETTVWVLNATLTQYKLEDDEDYHLVLSDASGNTLIAEIPSPGCVGAGSPFLAGIQNARSEFDARFTATTSFQTANIPVQIRGVGMFDFLHGQTGVAPNGIELHPVLDIIFNPSAADFGMTVSPASMSIPQGTAGSATVSTTVSGGFNAAVGLSVSGLPAGASAAFTPTSIPAPGAGSSTITVAAGASTAAGTYSLTVTGTGGGKTHTAALSLTVTAVSGGNAAYDPTLKAPKCPTIAAACDSGPSLLRGRASLGPEPNQPNTISSSCADGASGTFHSDESVDALKVTTTDGSSLAAGKTVTVTAAVWAYSTFSSDHLDLYFAPNATSPAWTLIGTVSPSAAGAQTLAANYTLPAGGSLQAVRANFRYGGTASPCSAGAYDDHDDLVFAVGAGAGDTTPPSTSITAPANGATVSGTITATASASDDVGVTKVELYVDGALKATDTASPYSFTWDTTGVANGGHSLASKAYDAAGNVGTSATVSVTVSNGTAQQLLGNPGFESGNVTWTASAGVITSSTGEAAHAGSWKGWLDGYGSTHTDTLWQQVAIPGTAATATLTFWLHVDTAETTTTTAFDTLQVQVRNASGTVLTTLATYSNLDAAAGYVQKTFDLAAYRGQTIRVYLVGAEDSTLQTSFVVDDFALNVQ
jgi:Big-like domain-containing protein